MTGGSILFVFLGLVGLVFFWRMLAGGGDRERIRFYIASRGGQVLSCDWAPFGRGWFGNRSDRIYEVAYVDQEGNEHEATCKTSMLTGVYWTEDRIVVYAKGHTAPVDLREQEHFRSEDKPQEDCGQRSVEELEAENRRLRQQLEWFRQDKQ